MAIVSIHSLSLDNRKTAIGQRGSCRDDSERDCKANTPIRRVLLQSPRRTWQKDLKFVQKQLQDGGIHNLKDLLQPGDWLAEVDLKDTIPIHT